jgi:hypothetical protein
MCWSFPSKYRWYRYNGSIGIFQFTNGQALGVNHFNALWIHVANYVDL